MKRATQRSKSTLTVLGRMFASPDLNRQEKGALRDAMAAVRERERRYARKRREEAEAAAGDAGETP